MKPIEYLDHDSHGVRLFKAEPTVDDKVKLTLSACSRNGGDHVCVSIDIECGAWQAIVKAAFYDREILQSPPALYVSDPEHYIPRARAKCGGS